MRCLGVQNERVLLCPVERETLTDELIRRLTCAFLYE